MTAAAWGAKRACPAAVFIAVLFAADELRAQEAWENVNLWAKWPTSTDGPTNPHADGHWAPPTPILTPTVPDGDNALFGVHASLVYGPNATHSGGNDERAKLVLFRNHTLVYTLDDSSPGVYALNTAGTQGSPAFPPNGGSTGTGHELFCAGYVPMADGKLLIVGGSFYHMWPPGPPYTEIRDGKATILDPSVAPAAPSSGESFWVGADDPPQSSGTNDTINWCDPPNFPLVSTQRYYPTCITLDDGKVLVLAGDYWTDCPIDPNGPSLPPNVGEQDDGEIEAQPRWMIYDPNASGAKWRVDVSGQPSDGFYNPWHEFGDNTADSTTYSYPHVKVLPFGLFYSGNDNPQHDYPTESVLWTPMSRWSNPADPPTAISTPKLKNRASANCVVLSLDATKPDIHVLMIGGGADRDHDPDPPMGSEEAEIITYSRSSSGAISSGMWRDAGNPGSTMARRDGNSILLPDGSVLAIGGENCRANHSNAACLPDCSDCNTCDFCHLCQEYASNQNKTCAIFTPSADPSSGAGGTWEYVEELGTTNNAVGRILRGHHSVALLLPDGRVFSSGHENQFVGTLGKDYQLYYPPYLFTSGNSLAPRDTIDTWPASVDYGLPFEITLRNDAAPNIDEVCLMAPSAPTHGTDFNQRRITLRCAAVPGDDGRLVVAGVKDSTYAPPGYYMLIALNNGVPSEARWVRVQRPPNSDAYVIASGQTKYWGGDVWLDRDFEILAGGTLVILPGTAVHVKAETDNGNRATTGISEILNRGRVLAVGTGLAGGGITFASYDGEDAAAEWGGIWFDLAATSTVLPGGVLAYGTDSRLENASIRNATVGVGIKKTGAPSLVGVTFSQIANNSHVFVDSTDVYVPYLGEWTLEPSTRVKLTRGTRPGQDITAGSQTLDAGKINVVVHGQLNALGTEVSRVYFEPDVVPTTFTVGDEWGGILFEGLTLGSIMSGADIGYAIKPITLVAQNTIIQNSTIHHFRDRAAWIYSYVPNSAAVGAVFSHSNIYRDTPGTATLNPLSGREGVVLEVCPDARIDSNSISLVGARNALGGSAIRILNTQDFCSKIPTSGTDSMVVYQNTLFGPGGALSPNFGLWAGIRGDWACGSNTARVVYLVYNQIEGWNDSAFHFVQGSDTQVTCNWTIEVRRGVEFFRDDPAGNAVRFLSNDLAVGAFDGPDDQSVVRTDDAPKLKLGPFFGGGGGNKGLNEIVALGEDWYLIENDNVSTNTHNAAHNYWKRDGIHHTTEAAVLDWVTTDIGGAANVAVTGPWQAPPPAEGCPGPSGTVKTPGEIVFDEAPGGEQTTVGTAVRLEGDLPIRTRLHDASPSPFSDVTRVLFDLGGPEVRDVAVAVFDVRGGLVRRVLDASAPGGRYEVQWDGRTDSGGHVSSGIYFIRMTSGRTSEVRKVVVVR